MAKIEGLCSKLPVPVIAKEVDNSIAENLAQKLINIGVLVIDTAGTLAGIALPWLKTTEHSEAALDILIAELKTALFCTGQGNLKDPKHAQVPKCLP